MMKIKILVNLTIIIQIYGANFTTFMKDSNFNEMRCSSSVSPEKTEIKSKLQCAYLCMRESTCRSVFYSDTTSQCFGCTTRMTSNSDLVPMTGSHYYHMVTTPEYIGCYADDVSGGPRAMGNPVLESPSMTVELCSDLCLGNGTVYLGVPYMRECYCRDTYDGYGLSTNCNLKCAGNQEQICGGNLALSVFKFY